MQSPLQITFRNLPPSDAISAKITQQSAKLARYCDRIMRCQVVVEAPHHNHRHGNTYQVRINLSLPGEELVINQNPAQNHAYENLYVAIRDTFNAAQRKLKRYAALQKA